MTPVMVKLLHDDAAGLARTLPLYTNVDLDQGIADFVGTAPGTFGNDFAVTERPLTTAEAATAAANGRSFAYVPFAASPVALMTLVPNSTYSGQPRSLRHSSASTSRSDLVPVGRYLRGPRRTRIGATAG